MDAKCEAANVDDVCAQQEQLNPVEKDKLKQLLLRYEELFDGTLGKWKGSPVELQLNKGVTLHHARAFPVPRVHPNTLKMEVERLCQLGVLRKVKRSLWAAPTFVIPKKDGTVRFISDFRELNKRIRRVPYPIPHIQDMLMNLEGFQHATSLDLNMGYYHLGLSTKSRELWTFGRYRLEYSQSPKDVLERLFGRKDFLAKVLSDAKRSFKMPKGLFNHNYTEFNYSILCKSSHSKYKIPELIL